MSEKESEMNEKNYWSPEAIAERMLARKAESRRIKKEGTKAERAESVLLQRARLQVGAYSVPPAAIMEADTNVVSLGHGWEAVIFRHPLMESAIVTFHNKNVVHVTVARTGVNNSSIYQRDPSGFYREPCVSLDKR